MAQRLDTRLSRLLLDRQAIPTSALEEAVQQQVVHGGALDTLLLECGVLDEEAVAEALSTAWETGPVDRADARAPDEAAVARLPRRIAATVGLCPFRDDDEGLHVMLAAPVDRDLLAEMAELIGHPLVPHVVPEVRLAESLAAAYQLPLDERMASLLRTLDGERMPAVPVSVEIELSPRGPAAELGKAAKAWDLPGALAELEQQGNREGIAEVATAWARRFLPFAAVFGVRDDKAVGWLRSGHCEGAQFDHRPLEVPAGSLLAQALANPSPLICRPPVTDGNSAFFGWLGRRRPQTVVLMPVQVAGRTVAVLFADAGVRKKEASALADLVAFGARIGPAFEALLRSRHRAHAELFEPRKDVPAPLPLDEGAAQREAAVETEPAVDGDDDVPAPPPFDDGEGEAELEVEVEQPAPAPARDGTSPFARGYAQRRPQAAAPEKQASPPPELDLDDDFLKGVEQEAAPAPARKKIDPGPNGENLRLPAVFGDVSDALAPAVTTWRTALRETVASGQQGGDFDDDLPVLVSEDEGDWEDIVLDAANARQLADKAAKESSRLTSGPHPPHPPADEDDDEDLDAAVLVERLASLHARVVAEAKQRLIALGEEALPALKDHFPGRLLMDPFAEHHPPDTAAELGPLIEVVEAIGARALEVAIPHLDARYPAHRFAATFLFNAIPDIRAIELLRPRLHDQEPRIRKLAAAALSHWVAHPDFSLVLVHLRQRLSSPAPEARQRAVWFLGYFRDVGSVPQLITLLDDHPEVARGARAALKQVTLQDLGSSRAWQRWWKKARRHTRIDWLIEGLRSKDRDLRYIASTELSRLAGDSFGYRCDDPKRDRDQAIKGFESWWDGERDRLGVPAEA